MYSYGDSSWLDLLTAYDGQSISYDSIGNPTSWYDGTTFTWSNGRRLTSAVNSSTGLNNSYTYDMDGLRLTKTVGSVEHKYVWQGSKLVAEYFGGTEFEFFYDENGAPYAFSYKATASATPVMYYYVTNLQGDVVSILNAGGTSVAEYSYNAWGKVLSATGTMAAINPIRYRGYYFDSDSGLYYVSNRYYDSEIGRFFSTDDIDYLGADGSLLGYNLFAYCLNNPVNRFDVNGNWSMPNWAKVTLGAVATVGAVTITVATGGAAAPVLIGVAASTLGGAAVGSVKHRVTTGSWKGAGQAALDGAADGFMTGGFCALGGSVVGGAVRTIRNAKSGITIGKMGTFEDVSRLANTQHYSGLKEFDFIKKVAGKKTAEAIGWWQNKCVVKGVMALNGSIYDCGGALTGAYAKEVALTRGYQYLYNIWLM